MKKTILIIGALLIVLNTVVGLVISSYEPLNFLMADLSIALSAGIMYFVACSKMADGFRIGLSVFFSFTGLVRYFCMALMPSALEDNVVILVAAGVLMLELACVAGASFANKK